MVRVIVRLLYKRLKCSFICDRDISAVISIVQGRFVRVLYMATAAVS